MITLNVVFIMKASEKFLKFLSPTEEKKKGSVQKKKKKS